ncbi:MAG: hypothetical protein Q4B31_00785 [Clostridia bacterium]|nr:hypothetical protein [Clostridia bacterium]
MEDFLGEVYMGNSDEYTEFFEKHSIRPTEYDTNSQNFLSGFGEDEENM